MRRFAAPMLLGAIATAALSSPAAAQGPYIFLGGGLSIPMGDFKNLDGAKTGWLATGGVGVDIGKKGAWIEAEGYYGSNKQDAPPTGDKTNVIAGFGTVGYSFGGAAKVHPYVLAGVGLLAHQFRSTSAPTTNSTETKAAFNAGAGLSFKLGPKADFWVEARAIEAKGTSIIPINAGFTIHLNK